MNQEVKDLEMFDVDSIDENNVLLRNGTIM